LKTVVLRTPVNEWLDPMKEAPRLRGLFLFLVQFVCQYAVPNSSAGPQGGI